MTSDPLIVAGGTGYLGRSLINAHAGSRPMLAIVRTAGSSVELPVPSVTYDQLERYELAPDLDPSRATVIHVAGSSRERWPGCVWEGNYGTVQRVVAAAKSWGVRRMVLASGYGIPSHSQSMMFQSKVAAEKLLLHEMPESTVVRLSYVLGGTDELTPHIRQHARARKVVHAPGTGSYRLNPTHINDVVSVFSRLALQRRDIIGSHNFVGEPVSYRKLIEDLTADLQCTIVDGGLEKLIRTATLDAHPPLTLSQIGVLLSDIWSPHAIPLADITPRPYVDIVDLLNARFRAAEPADT